MSKSEEEEIDVSSSTVLDGGNLNFGVGAFCDGIGIVAYEAVEDVFQNALYSVGKGRLCHLRPTHHPSKGFALFEKANGAPLGILEHEGEGVRHLVSRRGGDRERHQRMRVTVPFRI